MHNDRFLLDTNVILDVVAVSAESSDRSRAHADFLTRALRAGAEISISSLSFHEMAAVMERAEYRRDRGNAPPDGTELKRYRREPAARRRVLEKLAAAWEQARSFASVVGFEGGCDDAESVLLPLMRSCTLDAYDALLVTTARRERISNLVTDDADYARVEGVIVWTSNAKLLNG